MKMLCAGVAGLSLCLCPASAQDNSSRLSPPVNVVKPAPAPEAGLTSGEGLTGPPQTMLIEEDGTVKFLTPQEAAALFLPDPAASRFSIDLNRPADGPDSLGIEVTGADITESTTPDGSTRTLRGEPIDGSLARLLTITKD